MGSAATMAMTALYFTTIKSTKLTSTFRTLPRFTCSSSSKFNISFSPSNPKPKPTPQPKTQTPHDDDDEGPLMIPWIVRGEDGNFKLLSEPPPSFLKEMANAQTGTKKSEKDQITKNKKKGEKETKIRAVTAPPKYSKAARRFYNENIKDDSGTRLSKVLAASGGDISLPFTSNFYNVLTKACPVFDSVTTFVTSDYIQLCYFLCQCRVWCLRVLHSF